MKERVLRVIYTCNNTKQLISAIKYAELSGTLSDKLVEKAIRIKKHELLENEKERKKGYY